MEQQRKCSYKKHEEINAISYCIECNVFMCNKCLNLHSEFLDNHHKYNLDQNIEEIFTGICKEKNHKIKLEYYCNNHNQLCCAACLSKMKNKGYGQHTDCDVNTIEEIKDKKINKLKENIIFLEEISNKIENSVNELKKKFEEIKELKEQLKLKISKTFTQIRNVINEREDQLLLEVDNKFDKIFFKEDLIKQGEKLPSIIKKSLEKGKIIKEDLDINKIKLNSKINDCINIENIIINFNKINENITNINLNKKKVSFIPENNDKLNELLEKIRAFGEIKEDYIFFKFKPGKNYTVSENGLIATKTNGGDLWNCTIIGNMEIPKNKISKWKIKLNNFRIKSNTWNILIGIGPNNLNNENNFYYYCWSFICGESKLSIKSGSGTKYNNHSGSLKEGDIIETTVNRKLGTLSFAVNGTDYGIAYSKISMEDILYPIVMINDQNQTVELFDTICN